MKTNYKLTPIELVMVTSYAFVHCFLIQLLKLQINSIKYYIENCDKYHHPIGKHFILNGLSLLYPYRQFVDIVLKWFALYRIYHKAF